jgi:hypothetical protein
VLIYLLQHPMLCTPTTTTLIHQLGSRTLRL